MKEITKSFAVFVIVLFLMSGIAGMAIAKEGNESRDLDDDNEINDSEDNDGEIENEVEIEMNDDNEINDSDDENKTEIKMNRLNRSDGENEFEMESKRNKTEIKMKIKDHKNKLEIKISGRGINFSQLNNETLEFIVNNINARTDLNLTIENLTSSNLGESLRVKLSNGREAKVRIMPDEASEIALERLNITCDNCSIRLRETGKKNQTTIIYEIEQEEDARILGIFNKKIKVRAEVNAEDGNLVLIKKPWWAKIDKKVVVCHKPGINETNSSSGITIKIARPALKAHLAHGDYLGRCGAVNNTVINNTIGNNTSVNNSLINNTIVNDTFINETITNNTSENNTLINNTELNQTN